LFLIKKGFLVPRDVYNMNKRISRHGVVDLVLTRPGKNVGEKFPVQCKQWRDVKVGVDLVRELYGVMAAKGATGGRGHVWAIHRRRHQLRQRPQRHAGRWADASWASSASQGRSRSFKRTTGGVSNRATQSNECRADAGVELSIVRQAHGAANSQAGRECRF
jgi:Restriction endonuclease